MLEHRQRLLLRGGGGTGRSGVTRATVEVVGGDGGEVTVSAADCERLEREEISPLHFQPSPVKESMHLFV